jgi:O-antigen ligase/polysaccharide polymerase Wzy-like membrane protein
MPDTLATVSSPLRREAGDTLFQGDLYIALLGVLLLGYALMGKGFAYLGFPPLYVGEMAFLGGIIVFVRTGAGIAAVATLPAVLLLALMALVLARTLPFLGMYGFNALRDSVIVVYGGFAFIIIGLLLEDARRIGIILRYYRIMMACLPAMFVGSLLFKYWGENIPELVGPVPILYTSPSAVGTHLAGTMVFALIGYRKVSIAWLLVWFATLAVVGATNRGALLAAVLPVAIAMLALGRYRLMLSSVVVIVGVFTALLTFESSVGHFEEAKESIDRTVSAHQLLENAKSIIGQGGQQAEGTKQWRLNWWDIIINDTVHGPHFWTGRGFGLNLADADGFAGTQERPPTRSPHSAHMTMLARTGIPGLVMWLLVLASWFAMMMGAILTARVREDKRWAELFIFIVCYELAILINATFDVVLEGPMQGIWFWCLFGFGVGSVMIYRGRPFSETEGGR